jgi:4-hydroxy-3-methylbut-2-enyl diphosphate reductase IspH
LNIVNATCPEVAKVHHKIKKWSPKGYFTVILGSHGHAESVAHRSFADSGSIIVANMAEAEALTDEQLKKVLVVAQTTFTVKDYQAITEYLRTRAGEAVFENTICEDTWMRQDEAR